MAFCEDIPTLLYTGSSGVIARHKKQSHKKIKASYPDLQMAKSSIKGGRYVTGSPF
jgi:hypothetical protein